MNTQDEVNRLLNELEVSSRPFIAEFFANLQADGVPPATAVIGMVTAAGDLAGLMAKQGMEQNPYPEGPEKFLDILVQILTQTYRAAYNGGKDAHSD